MSANPLKRAADAPIGYSEEHLIGLCDANNRWAYRIGYPKWYYVEPAGDGSVAAIRVVDGIEAQEVWAVLDGKGIDYAGWTQDRIEKIERRARWLIKQGIIRNERAAA